MLYKIKKFFKHGIIVPVLCTALICTMSTAFAASTQKSAPYSGNFASGTIIVYATKNSSTGAWSFTANRTVSSVTSGYSVGNASPGKVSYSDYGDTAETKPYVEICTVSGTLLNYYYSNYNIIFTFNGSIIV